jgi:hypothetical protein
VQENALDFGIIIVVIYHKKQRMRYSKYRIGQWGSDIIWNIQESMNRRETEGNHSKFHYPFIYENIKRETVSYAATRN